MHATPKDATREALIDAGMREPKTATVSKREVPYSSLFEVKGVCIILVRKVSENLVRS